VSSTALSGLTTSSTITVNGISISIGLASGNTIDTVVNNINNRTGDTRATAVKNSQTIVNDTGFVALTTAGSTQTLTLNGVNIALTTGNAGTVSDFVTTVNGYTNQTGVSVSTSGSNVVFTRASGGDITIYESSSSSFGVGDTVANTSSRTFNAGFTLSVDLDQSLTVTTSSTANDIGFTTGVVGTTPTSRQISNLNIGTATGANDAIQTIDFALTFVGRVRGDLGAVQNRFSSTISSLQVAAENISAARSRIKDADIAHETAELTRNQILLQAGTAVLAQANQLPQVALSLLGR
jgi:flagellin